MRRSIQAHIQVSCGDGYADCPVTAPKRTSESPYHGENSEPGRYVMESLTTNPRVREQPGPIADIARNTRLLRDLPRRFTTNIVVRTPLVLPSSATGGEPTGETWLSCAPSRTGTATVDKIMTLEARGSEKFDCEASDSEERPRKLPKAVLAALNRSSARFDNSVSAGVADATEVDEVLAKRRRLGNASGLKALFEARTHAPDK